MPRMIIASVREDSTVALTVFNNEKTYEENLLKLPDYLANLPHFEVQEIPQTKQHWEQLYAQNGQLLCDENWESLLMPGWLVKKKALEDLELQIDSSNDENEKMNLMIQHNYLHKKPWGDENGKTNQFWLQKGLEGLDKRVQEGKADKAVVRQKLQAKLAELENGGE